MATKLRFYQTITFTVLFVGYGIYSYNRKSVTYTVPKLVEEGISKENAGRSSARKTDQFGEVTSWKFLF